MKGETDEPRNGVDSGTTMIAESGLFLVKLITEYINLLPTKCPWLIQENRVMAV
jgi:hypothetical protein